MDDFLHNLRSGKLKQHDRSNRSYNDQQYKGSQRRNTMDRRKKGNDASEQLSAIKELLESVSETQKRIAAAQESRAKSEERKARAMEILANNIYRMFNPNAEKMDELPVQEACPAPAEAAEAIDGPALPDPEESETGDTRTDDTISRKMTAETRKEVFDLIGKMREEGLNWEKIARSIATQGYPTVSGKGSWRGVMAKNLYEKMAVE